MIDKKNDIRHASADASVDTWLRKSREMVGSTENEIQAVLSHRKTRSFRSPLLPGLPNVEDRDETPLPGSSLAALDSWDGTCRMPLDRDLFGSQKEQASMTQSMLPPISQLLDTKVVPVAYRASELLEQGRIFRFHSPSANRKQKLVESLSNRLRCGTILRDRFVLEAFLGATSTGDLYKVWDQRLEKTYACRMYPLSHRGDLAYMQAFVREYKQQERLQHPHIVRCCSLEYEPGLRVPFALFEWADGENLQRMFSREGKARLFSPQELLSIVEQLSSALSYMTSQDVPFVGLHPRLIQLQKHQARWNVKLLRVVWVGPGHDAETQELPLVPNLQEMSIKEREHAKQLMNAAPDPFVAPELRFREQAASARSTVYALGVLCFRSLFGDQPLSVAHRENSLATAPDAKVKEILLRATQPDQRLRQPTVLALLQELKAALAA